MRSPLQRLAAVLAAVLLSLTLSSCQADSPDARQKQSEPQSEKAVKIQTIDYSPDADALDPRYAQGAFGAWRQYLPTDQKDFAALGKGDKNQTHFQAWVTPDGSSVVIAYSLFAYPSSIASLNVADGSTRWSVNLAQYRTPTPTQDIAHPEIEKDQHCLPALAGVYVACDNVGFINITTGEVTTIDDPVDFQGTYTSGNTSLIAGNIYPSTPGEPSRIGVWTTDGKKVWEKQDRTFSYAGVGQGTAATAVIDPATLQTHSYEIVNLEDGEVVNSFLASEKGEKEHVERVSYTTDGYLVLVRIAHGPSSERFESRIYDPSQGKFSLLTENLELVRATLAFSHYPPETLESAISASEMTLALSSEKRFEQHGRAQFLSHDGTLEALAPASIEQVSVDGDYGIGVTVSEDAFLAVKDSEVLAWNPHSQTIWKLPIDLSPFTAHSKVIRAGGYLLYLSYGHEWNTVLVTLIAPGKPGESVIPPGVVLPSGTSLPSWMPSEDYLKDPDNILSSLPVQDDVDSSGADSPSDSSTASAKVEKSDNSALSQVEVQHVQNSNTAVTGLQEFANDLAAGRFDKIREYCWTVSPSTMERQYFSPASRQALLEAISKPGKKIDGGGEWLSSGGKVVATDDELSSPYACPLFYPGGEEDPLTFDDVDLLMRRAVGVARNKPIRQGDDGHYQLVCNGTLDVEFANTLEKIRSGNMQVHRIRTNGIHSVYSAESPAGSVLISRGVLSGTACIMR